MKTGVKTYTCSVCGDSYTEPIPALGHDWGDWTVVSNSVAATCTEAGKTAVEERICKNDSNHKETRGGATIPAKGHRLENNQQYCLNGCGTVNPDYVAPNTQQNENQGSQPAAQQTQSTEEQIADIAKQYGVSSATLALNETNITSAKSDGDFKGSSYARLQVQNSKTAKNSITLKWNKVKGADGYIIYGNKCGKNNKYKKIKTQKGTSFTQKKLKKGTYYKYMVVAYKNVNGQKVTIAASPTMHICTAGGKKGNPKSVKVNKKKVTLKKGKSFKIKATQVKDKKAFSKHKGVRYESSNTEIATVSKSGKVKAKKKGKATIYCYAQNGKMTKVTVSVK